MKSSMAKGRRSIGSVVEDWKMELSELECSRVPQEDLQSQIIWVHGASQKLNHQPKRIQELDLGLLHICSRYEAQSACDVGPLPSGVELSLSLLLAIEFLSPT